jgi:hypothetical protein
MQELTINDTSRDGLLQIMDTSALDAAGTMRVTVRDMTYSGQDQTDAMRRLARRAYPYPEHIRSSRVIRRFKADGCPYVTFAVAQCPF